MNEYTVYAAKLCDTLISGATDDQALQSNLAKLIIKGDGSPYPNYIAPMSAQPLILFGTTSIKQLLDAIGVLGSTITGSPCVFFCQKLSELGRSSGSDHLSMSVAAGAVIPISLNAQQDEQGGARMIAHCVPAWDGTNNPIVTALAALSGTPSVGQAYTVGPLMINGTKVGGEQSLRVEWNINLRRPASAGEAWSRNVFLLDMDPVITYTTTEVTLLNTLGPNGIVAGANTAAYLQKLDPTLASGRDPTTAIAIAAQGHAEWTTVSGTPQMAEVVITPKKVGENAIMTVNTATSLPE